MYMLFLPSAIPNLVEEKTDKSTVKYLMMSSVRGIQIAHYRTSEDNHPGYGTRASGTRK